MTNELNGSFSLLLPISRCSTPDAEVEEKLGAYRTQLLAKLEQEASAAALKHKDEQ